MSPVAVELIQDLPTTSHQQKRLVVVTASGLTLVIGSPLTAQDGTYPSLISELERDPADAGEVERQMLDRVLDGGVLFSPYFLLTQGTDSDQARARTQLLQ